MKTRARGSYFVDALGRGLALLDCFVHGPDQLTLRELSERVGINKNRAFRLLRTLEEGGYVRQDPETKRYQLSLKVLDLQDASLTALGYIDDAQPFLEALNETVGESVNLAVLEEDKVRYVARVASKRIMSVNLHVGMTLPAHATSLGKVLLASLPPARVREIYEGRSLELYTPYTITSLRQLLQELESVRRQGYALSEQELEIGLRSVSAPVRQRRGEVIAALNVSTAVSHVPKERLLGEILPEVIRTAAAISSRLGFRPANGAAAVELDRGTSRKRAARPAHR